MHEHHQPGYMWHEADHWDPRTRRWIFLPRKVSQSVLHDPHTDELMGSNIFIVASEDFTTIDVRTVDGGGGNDRGFTAVRKVPGTANDFAALSVREVGDHTATWMVVFDITDGRVLLEDVVADGVKYEGLEFL